MAQDPTQFQLEPGTHTQCLELNWETHTQLQSSERVDVCFIVVYILTEFCQCGCSLCSINNHVAIDIHLSSQNTFIPDSISLPPATPHVL